MGTDTAVGRSGGSAVVRSEAQQSPRSTTPPPRLCHDDSGTQEVTGGVLCGWAAARGCDLGLIIDGKKG